MQLADLSIEVAFFPLYWSRKDVNGVGKAIGTGPQLSLYNTIAKC